MNIQFRQIEIRFILLFTCIILSACGTGYIKDSTALFPDTATVTMDSISIAEDTVRIIIPDTLRIVAVGDVMMGTEGRLPADDGVSSFTSCADLIQSADIAFLNLEGPLTNRGAPTKNVESGSSYCFRTPPSYIRFIEEAGFNMVSLANNHSRDYGQEGIEQTIALLENSNITWSGAPGTVASININGLSVVMVAFSPYYTANMISDIPAAREIVSELTAEYDIVIVSFHGGAEGADAVHVPFETEYFYGENRGDVVQFSRAVVDAGADLVIGHGPHVPRAAEVYEGRLIAYSLGNFCTGMGINSSGRNGYAPLLLVELDSEGALLSGEVVSFRQGYDQPPLLDPENRAAELMYQLGVADFPQSNAVRSDGTLCPSTDGD